MEKTLLLLFVLLVSLLSCDKDEQETIISDLDTFTGETIFVNGGTFQMGSLEGTGHSDEHPQHSVFLNSFRISKYEITNQQYANYMNAIGADSNGSVDGIEYLDMDSSVQISHNGSLFIVDVGKDNHPITQVSWYGAKAYSEYYGGRLPTEAEWEFASKGGNSSNGYTYSGSNTLDDVAWNFNNSGLTTHNVGTKNANELGLYDMTGNVSEWTNDWYDSNYYINSSTNNPQGASPEDAFSRVFRGGSNYSPAYNCRTTHRYNLFPDMGYYFLGFRPVFLP